jgi:cytochrome P450
MPQQVTDVRSWPRVDLRGVEFHPMMAELLGEECPVRVALPQGGEPAWVFTHYDEVKAVTGDPRFSRAAVRGADATRLTQLRLLLDGDLTYQDGNAHTRRQLAKALTPARIEVLERVSVRICDSLMDAVLAQGPPADLVADLVSPYALELAGRLVGVPEQYRDRQLCDRFETVFSIRSAPEEARSAQDALRELFQELVSTARAVRPEAPDVRPGGLITALAGADAELTDQEVVAAAYHVTQAAWHGIRNQGGNLLYILLSRPDLAARLRGRPAAWPAALHATVGRTRRREDRHRGRHGRRCHRAPGRSGLRLLRLSQPGRAGLPRPGPDRPPTARQPAPGLRPRPAPLPGVGAGGHGAAHPRRHAAHPVADRPTGAPRGSVGLADRRHPARTAAVAGDLVST